MSDRQQLAAEYAAALHDHLSGGGERALARAYALGREAATHALGVLDVAAIHHDALSRMASAVPAPSLLTAAGQFLVEALSPFEMALRAFQANARLLGLSETLARQNTEVNHAHMQLRSILDATTALISLQDANGRYLFVNRQFEHVFGVRRDDAIGKTMDDVIPREVAQVLRANDDRVLAAAIPAELEESIALPDGVHTYLSLKFPLVDSSGAPHAICHVATDITERKRADEAVRAARDAAERANRELEAFSHSVAHDLRAPLRTIDGYSSVLLAKHGASLDAGARACLDRVLHATQSMSRMIDDLLMLSRVGSAELCRTRVDLSALAREAIDALRAQEPGRHVDVDITPELADLGDPGLLRIALANLLGNAWKYTGRQPHARISFGTSVQAQGRVYFVRDNGAGFDMKHAGRLFTAFQRLHATDEFPGNGIGLTTVERIVQRHEGRVWAFGAVGEGAVFHFTLWTQP